MPLVLPVAVFLALLVINVGAGALQRDSEHVPIANVRYVVGCEGIQELLPDRILESSSTLDPETGTMTIEVYGPVDTIVTTSTSDSVCLADPVIGPMMQRHLESSRDNQASECAAFAQGLGSGKVHVRGRDLDLYKVKAYMDRWC